MPALARGRIEITLSDRQRKRAVPIIRKAVIKGQQRAAKESRKTVKRFTPRFTRKLLNSYKIKTNNRKMRVTVVSFVRHAKVMEFGRSKGARMPPSKKLLPWVKKRFKISGKGSRAKARSAAFGLARNIKKRGIKITIKGGLSNPWNRGRGAMFRRTVNKLGAGFFSEHIASAIKNAEARLR